MIFAMIDEAVSNIERICDDAFIAVVELASQTHVARYMQARLTAVALVFQYLVFYKQFHVYIYIYNLNNFTTSVHTVQPVSYPP